MIRTYFFSSTTKHQRPAGDLLSAQDGFGLIEVLISSVLIAVIAIATFTGFDVSNRASADEQTHAQASAIAEQWEERLRGEQTSEISALSRSFCVNRQGIEVSSTVPCPGTVTGTSGTIFTVETTGRFISDKSSAKSCSSSAPSADYIQTTTTVSWPALGNRPPVSESSVVTPPISAALLVQDTNGTRDIPNVTVTETGPSPSATSSSLVTNVEGCVIFSDLTPGEYTIKASQPGYVGQYGEKEVLVTKSLTAGVTTVVPILYDLAGKLEGEYVEPTATTPRSSAGDSFVTVNTGLHEPRIFGTVGTFSSTLLASKTVFPFPSPQTVYAGSCTSNDPHIWNNAVTDATFSMEPGGSANVALEVPSISLKIPTYSGGPVTTSSERGTIVEEPALTPESALPVKGTCGETTKRRFTVASGKLSFYTVAGEPRSGLPYGGYKLCFEAKPEGHSSEYVYSEAKFKSESPTGTTIAPEVLKKDGTTKPCV